MSRILMQAATYRKFTFSSEAALADYMKGGCQERHLVSKEKNGDLVIAVIGETYNRAEYLEMKEDKHAD